MKKKNNTRVGSEAKYDPRLAGEILHDYLENSDEPFARAYRQHVADEKEDETRQLFENIFPNTELGIDLKLFTLKPGRMSEGEFLAGMLTRDGEDHFRFVEHAPRKKRVMNKRNPQVYSGACINVSQQGDGTLYPSFCRPHYTEDYTFKHFCLKAAEELLLVAGLVGEEVG